MNIKGCLLLLHLNLLSYTENIGSLQYLLIAYLHCSTAYKSLKIPILLLTNTEWNLRFPNGSISLYSTKEV